MSLSIYSNSDFFPFIIKSESDFDRKKASRKYEYAALLCKRFHYFSAVI